MQNQVVITWRYIRLLEIRSLMLGPFGKRNIVFISNRLRDFHVSEAGRFCFGCADVRCGPICCLAVFNFIAPRTMNPERFWVQTSSMVCRTKVITTQRPSNPEPWGISMPGLGWRVLLGGSPEFRSYEWIR